MPQFGFCPLSGSVKQGEALVKAIVSSPTIEVSPATKILSVFMVPTFALVYGSDMSAHFVAVG